MESYPFESHWKRKDDRIYAEYIVSRDGKRIEPDILLKILDANELWHKIFVRERRGNILGEIIMGGDHSISVIPQGDYPQNLGVFSRDHSLVLSVLSEHFPNLDFKIYRVDDVKDA